MFFPEDSQEKVLEKLSGELNTVVIFIFEQNYPYFSESHGREPLSLFFKDSFAAL